MIPVLGVPILTRPDILMEMLVTLDYEIGTIILIDNGCVLEDSLAERSVGCKIRIIRPIENLGVAASWNEIMASEPDAPWWFISGFDVLYSPGDIENLAARMAEEPNGMGYLDGYSSFGISRAVVEKVGIFDENFMPAYFEDNDYYRRCKLAGVPMRDVPSGVKHRRSATIRSCPLYVEENRRTFPLNAEYYQRKWGGLPGGEAFTTPFDLGGDLRSWQPEPGRRAAQKWKKE
jgi:GT2 family glycosyltransferase